VKFSSWFSSTRGSGSTAGSSRRSPPGIRSQETGFPRATSTSGLEGTRRGWSLEASSATPTTSEISISIRCPDGCSPGTSSGNSGRRIDGFRSAGTVSEARLVNGLLFLGPGLAKIKYTSMGWGRGGGRYSTEEAFVLHAHALLSQLTVQKELKIVDRTHPVVVRAVLQKERSARILFSAFPKFFL